MHFEFPQHIAAQILFSNHISVNSNKASLFEQLHSEVLLLERLLNMTFYVYFAHKHSAVHNLTVLFSKTAKTLARYCKGRNIRVAFHFAISAKMLPSLDILYTLQKPPSCIKFPEIAKLNATRIFPPLQYGYKPSVKNIFSQFPSCKSRTFVTYDRFMVHFLVILSVMVSLIEALMAFLYSSVTAEYQQSHSREDQQGRIHREFSTRNADGNLAPKQFETTQTRKVTRAIVQGQIYLPPRVLQYSSDPSHSVKGKTPPRPAQI